MDDVRAGLGVPGADRRAPEAPVAGGRRGRAAGRPRATRGHGLTGTDEAGSGGDD